MEPATIDSRYMLIEDLRCFWSRQTKTNFVLAIPVAKIKGTFQNQWMFLIHCVKNKVKNNEATKIIKALKISKKICFFFHDEKLYKFHLE